MVKGKTQLIAECCVCGKHVPFTDGDRNNLLKHSEESHAKERVVRYDILKATAQGKSSNTSNASKSSKNDDTNQEFQFGHAVVCPCCKHVGPPILRRQNKSKKPFAMMSGCCPLIAMACFLSCCTPRVAHVYCRQCTKYLGTYNTRTGKYTLEEAKEGVKEGAKEGAKEEEKDEGQKKSNKTTKQSKSKSKNKL